MKNWIFQLGQYGSKTLQEISKHANQRSVRLAITGLSQAGKSTFITAMLQQLNHAHHSNNLPFFRALNAGYFLGAQINTSTSSSSGLSTFAYDTALQALEKQQWPLGTSSISNINISIHYRPQGLHAHFSDHAVLNVELIDYPGEWLLDLPLLQQSYEDWSRVIGRLCKSEPRLSLSRNWREYLQQQNLAQPASEQVLKNLKHYYTDFLLQCKQPEHSLSLIQPGRFVLPGEYANQTILDFCPCVDLPDGPLPDNSLYMQLKKRYEQYCEEIVKSFYTQHFSHFDRQVILVDVLKTLNHGMESYRDMQAALQTILRSFHYGKSSWLSRLFSPKIDKLLFAATKADHASADQRRNLRLFLRNLISESENQIRCAQVETDILQLASISCSRGAVAEIDGRQQSCVVGIDKNSAQEVRVFPGEIPDYVPDPADWHPQKRFHFIDFLPPKIADIHSAALPHINMDKALEYLLGDKLS